MLCHTGVFTTPQTWGRAIFCVPDHASPVPLDGRILHIFQSPWSTRSLQLVSLFILLAPLLLKCHLPQLHHKQMEKKIYISLWWKVNRKSAKPSCRMYTHNGRGKALLIGVRGGYTDLEERNG